MLFFSLSHTHTHKHTHTLSLYLPLSLSLSLSVTHSLSIFSSLLSLFFFYKNLQVSYYSILSTYLFTEYYHTILGCVQVDHYTGVSPYSYTNSAVGSYRAKVVTLLYRGPPFNILSEGRSVFHLT